ncbi:MAG: hypothetical protein R2729_02600 [Bryobacteraceae bacterium]
MKWMILTLIAIPMVAQEGKPQQAKIVEVRHKKPCAIAALIHRRTPAAMDCSDELGSISLSGAPEAVAMAEGMIRQLDQPAPERRSIEITAYMVLGTSDKTTDLPKPLSGVAAQLQQVFPYAGFRLIETMLVRGREGEGGEASGLMPVPGEPEAKPIYQFRYRECRVTGDSGARRFELRDIRFGAKVPIATDKGSFQYIDTGVNTTVDIREGQKAVIGKASLGPGKESLFLVLSARVAE